MFPAPLKVLTAPELESGFALDDIVLRITDEQGSVAGALLAKGVPEVQAPKYGSKVRQGGILISVHVHRASEVHTANTIYSYFLLPVANLFEGAFFGGGTLPPACRASDSPIAIACLRLVTFLPDLPLFKVPALSSRITLVTFSDAFLPYLLAIATLVVRGSSFTLESRTSKALSVSPILRAAARAW